MGSCPIQMVSTTVNWMWWKRGLVIFNVCALKTYPSTRALSKPIVTSQNTQMNSLSTPHSSFSLGKLPTRVQKFQEPSVWLEFSPLSLLCNAINLGQGFPDWRPPRFVLEAAEKAVLDPSLSQYARSSGLLQLVTAISRYYSPLLGRQIDANREVCITVGASEAIFLTCQAFIEPGDEVVFIEPAFDIYYGAAIYAGATIKFVPLCLKKKNADETLSAGDFTLDLDELKSVFSDKTRLLVLNSPHNPTGKVFSKEELEGVANVVKQYPRCLVLCDEVYQHLVYDDMCHVPFATIQDMWRRTISVYSAGKTFSVTGWKIGWAIGPSELIRPLMLSQQWVVFSTTTPLQYAVASALEQACQPFENYSTYYEWLRMSYQQKRDYFYDVLKEAGYHPIKPQGSFFIMVDISETNDKEFLNQMPEIEYDWWQSGKLDIDERTKEAKDYNFCRWLTVEKGVTAIPSSAFYSMEHRHFGSHYVRFSFCKNDTVLEQAKERLQKGKK